MVILAKQTMRTFPKEKIGICELEGENGSFLGLMGNFGNRHGVYLDWEPSQTKSITIPVVRE